MRLSTSFLVLLSLALLCCMAFMVAAQEEAVNAGEVNVESSSEQTQNANGEVPVDGEVPADDKPNNPWVKQKLSGLPIGENSALAVPVPILLMIGAVFFAAVGYGVWMIFDSDKQRARKQEEIKAKRAAKEAKKGSKKK